MKALDEAALVWPLEDSGAAAEQGVCGVERDIAAAGCDGLHRGWQVEGQTPTGPRVAEEDVDDGVVAGAEVDQQGAGRRGDLRHDGRSVQEQHDDRRHQSAYVDDPVTL